MNQPNKPRGKIHAFNLNPATLNATFSFDPVTGQITNQISAAKGDKTEISEDEFVGRLISEAEQIREYPDASMFFPVDESDYGKF